MMDDILLKLIDAIQNLAPEVWRIMVKQAISNGVSYLTAALICLAVATGCLVAARGLFRKAAEQGGNTDLEVGGWGCRALAAAAAIIGVAMLTVGVQHLVNPEYYAIMLLSD